MENEILNNILNKVTNIETELFDIKKEVAKISSIEKEVAKISSIEKEVAKISSIEKEVAEIPFIKKEVAKIASMQEELEIIKKSTLIMEHEHGRKLDLLLECYNPLYEKQASFDARLAHLEYVSDLHSFQLKQLQEN